VIVTGGFDRDTRLDRNISTDRAALRGAVRFASRTGTPLEKHFQTWVPERSRDREGVVRFREGFVRELKGKSAQARRLTMVQQVEAVVTAKGKTHTALVLDQAFALDRPVLPLPFTGGDSQDYWNENKESIVDAFQLSDDLVQRLEAGPAQHSTEMTALAREVADHIWNASSHLTRVCLVLSPFRKELEAFYDNLLKPAVEAAGFDAIRLDRTTDTGNIAQLFVHRLTSADAVIADVTDGNANVLYELGHAHARGIEPLLYSRKKLGDEVWRRLPFYLYQHKVLDFDVDSDDGRLVLIDRLHDFLRGIRSKRAATTPEDDVQRTRAASESERT
jgi:hypothetical protein